MKVAIGDTFTNKYKESVCVIKYVNSNKVLVEYDDKHKCQRYYQAGDLRRGNFKNPFRATQSNIGYLGNSKGNKEPSYTKWVAMITRCYGTYNNPKNTSYSNTIVVEEWLNLEEFSKWYNSQPYLGNGYELDKDILGDGSNVYSPLTCCLVPKEVNQLLISQSNDSTGVYLDTQDNKYVSRLSKKGVRETIGRYSNKDKAIAEYDNAKEIYIKHIAEEYKSKLRKDVYNKLINWKRQK